MCLTNHIQSKELISIKANLETLNKCIEKGEKKLCELFKKNENETRRKRI
jgi:hypothetical protein